MIADNLRFIENSQHEILISFYKNLFTQLEDFKAKDSDYQVEIKFYLLELKNQIDNAIKECCIDLKVRLVDDEIIKLEGDTF